MTIQDVLDWLQEAENNGINTVGTQNVKRHLEEVQKQEMPKDVFSDLMDNKCNSQCENCTCKK